MTTMTHILLSFAGRDADSRSLLLAATRAAGIPVRFVEVPGVVTDPTARRALHAAKLQQCDASIVLVSPHALTDPSVELDVRAAREAGVPVHGIAAGGQRHAPRLPSEWGVAGTVEWNWPRIAAFLQRLPARPRCTALAC